MIAMTDKENEPHLNQTNCHHKLSKDFFKITLIMINDIAMLEAIVIILVNIEVLHIAFVI